MLITGFCLFWLAPQALATWSIVIMNRKTGEVGVAAATCIPNIDLRSALPVIVVGKGAAAAQSFIDTSGSNRQQIRHGIEAGWDAQTILRFLDATDNQHQTRQYGMVSRRGDPVTFTGTGAGLARFGVVGTVGDYDYSIQGNVLTGDEVVLAAEAALRASTGDMGQRMMQGMEAAMQMGGDGRCSCTTGLPTSCGVPPQTFTHSAFTGFLIVARPGDTDGTCSSGLGCANGDYYANLNFAGNATTPDPVVALRGLFDTWRAGLSGVPDQFRSQLTSQNDVMQAGGNDFASVVVTVRDILGTQLAQGVSNLEVTQTSGPESATLENIVDHGDGTYSIAWRSTQIPGQATFAIDCVLPDNSRIRLHPEVTLQAQAPRELFLTRSRYQTGQGTQLPVLLDLGQTHAGSPYRIYASTSGTQPGTQIGSVQLPLNHDALLTYTQTLNGGSPFNNSVGTLDVMGRTSSALALPANRLIDYVGSTLSFAAIVQGPSGPQATNAASILIEY